MKKIILFYFVFLSTDMLIESSHSQSQSQTRSQIPKKLKIKEAPRKKTKSTNVDGKDHMFSARFTKSSAISKKKDGFLNISGLKKKANNKRTNLEERRLLSIFNLPKTSFDFMASLRDQGLQQQAEELKNFMRRLAPAYAQKGEKQKSYEDYLNMAKKRLHALQTQQLKKYDDWKKKSWKSIEKLLEEKQKVFDVNPKLNIQDNEKYYQLFLIEDAEKREHLIPFLDFETRLLEIIEEELVIIQDYKSFKNSSKRLNKRNSRNMLRRHRRIFRRTQRAYLRGVRKLHKSYMQSWEINEKFAGQDD